MTTLELQLFLDNLAELNFLDAVLKMKEKEKDYLKTDFYKSTRIPILKLYESYLQYSALSADRVDELTEAIENMNMDRLAGKLSELLLKTLEDENIKEKIKNFSEGFNLEDLMSQSEELEEVIEKLK